MNRAIALLLTSSLLSSQTAFAGEGMWTFHDAPIEKIVAATAASE